MSLKISLILKGLLERRKTILILIILILSNILKKKESIVFTVKIVLPTSSSIEEFSSIRIERNCSTDAEFISLKKVWIFVENYCRVTGRMKTNGLKRTVILRVFCQMRGETAQVFRKEIYEDQAFSVESFLQVYPVISSRKPWFHCCESGSPILHDQALQRFLTRNHGNPIDFQRLMT